MSGKAIVRTFAADMLAVLALALMLSTATATALTGPNGIIAPTGTNPRTGEEWKEGDTYHLVFTTTGTIDSLSGDISVYNAFVNSQADASTATGVPETEWFAVASTTAVHARDNAPVAAPVYLLDGSYVADGATGGGNPFYDDNPIATTLTVDQHGNPRSAANVWTGSNRQGLQQSSRQLGSGGANRFGSMVHLQNYIDAFNMADEATEMPMYAISEVLTVGSESTGEGNGGSLLLISGGLLFLVRRKTRRK